ncbi:MAG: hypothetical protein R3D69_08985 [Xanthobacteraceae bacterium]
MPLLFHIECERQGCFRPRLGMGPCFRALFADAKAKPFQSLESLKMRSFVWRRGLCEHEFITAFEIERRQDNAVTAKIARNVRNGVALSAGERRGASPLFQEG